MKHVLLMSLLSLLFGCNTKKTPSQPEAYPRFPASDEPGAQITPVALDSGYSPKAFFIAPDQQQVFVLAYQLVAPPLAEGEAPLPGVYDLADYRLFSLDGLGQIRQRLNLPRGLSYGAGSFGLLNDQVLLRTKDGLLVLDPENLTITETIPVYDLNVFPSKRNVERMTPDERQEIYPRLFHALLEKPASCKWLDWAPGGEYLVLHEDAAGKRSAWSPMMFEEATITDVKGRLEPVELRINPHARVAEANQKLEIADGTAQIREAEYLSAGTQLDYPNYKNRTVVQYEMTLGSKKIHFSTTDKDRHNLYLGFADNLLLTTQDGTAWVKYEGVLYRIK